jgi:hypothetical protein
MVYCLGDTMICLSKINMELTLVWVSLVPGISVPVCCIAIDRNVTLCAVEHKKLRIIHKLLCVKMQTDQSL